MFSVQFRLYTKLHWDMTYGISIFIYGFGRSFIKGGLLGYSELKLNSTSTSTGFKPRETKCLSLIWIYGLDVGKKEEIRRCFLRWVSLMTSNNSEWIRVSKASGSIRSSFVAPNINYTNKLHLLYLKFVLWHSKPQSQAWNKRSFRH